VLARPLIEATVGQPTTAIARVKWYHYRAVLTLAQHLRSLQRIYTVTYDPCYPPNRVAISRDNWTATSRARVRHEYLAIQHLRRGGGVSGLHRSNRGWVRG
jgi:hypothetical protein